MKFDMNVISEETAVRVGSYVT